MLSKPHRRRTRIRLILALMGAAFVSGNAFAADIEVTNNLDSGSGSLRAALAAAEDEDRIVFNLPAASTITLLSDLPTVAGSISFANINAVVDIDRNGFDALDLNGALIDPTVLSINTGGVPSADADIIAAASSTVFGDGTVTGNLEAPGTIAPGANSDPGTIGTLAIVGELDAAGAQLQLDIAGTSNDLITVTGAADITGATLAPNFVGDAFSAGQTFLVVNAGSLTGAFTNPAEIHQLPNNPFLRAIQDPGVLAGQFGYEIEDNGLPFTSIVSGCNQLRAAAALDEMFAAGVPPTGVTDLRNASTTQATMAVHQLSGAIYSHLVGAEIHHIQNNVESIRDRVGLQRFDLPSETGVMPWVRAYGVGGFVDADDCETPGYRHEVGGLELGVGVDPGGALTGHIFGHLATANLNVRGVDQQADIDSYRLGGMLQYQNNAVYVILAGGGGYQDYDVERSLSAIPGSVSAVSAFDGSSSFAYVEMGPNPGGLFSPYVALHLTQVEIDPIAESGDAEYALTNPGADADSVRSVVGISMAQSNHMAATRLRFGWLHEYLNESESITSDIAAASATTPLFEDGLAQGLDWAFVRTQIDMGVLLGGQMSVAYQGQVNAHSSFNMLVGGIHWIY